MRTTDGQGTFFKDYNDPLGFGPGEATAETFMHNSADDGLIVLAAFNGVDGSFLWATSHRRTDTQIFQPGSAGIFLNADGEVVMLLVSGAKSSRSPWVFGAWLRPSKIKETTVWTGPPSI